MGDLERMEVEMLRAENEMDMIAERDVLIVTHGGRAHRDDFLSVCILVNYFVELGVNSITVDRRNPTPEELLNPSVIVVDVGGMHDPSLNNFDHHQHNQPICALQLVINDLRWKHRFLPWLKPTSILDTRGPKGLAEYVGADDWPAGMASPIEMAILHDFSEATRLYWEVDDYADWHWLATTIRTIGFSIWKAYDEQAQSFYQMMMDGTLCSTLADTGILMSEKPYSPAALAELELEIGVRAEICIGPDDRGDGWSIYADDDFRSKYNLTVLEGDGRFSFVHKGGFIAKTKERLPIHVMTEEIVPLIAELTSKL
jgi:hypothetical protein